ncbi:MAG: UDP-glucose 4-epimerase GalE [Patescibacteria group bacterium]
MRILVTGGAGYIGSVTVRRLLDEGFAVTVADNFENGHREALDPRSELFEGNLHDPDFLSRVFTANNFDGLIHFAGYIESGESMRDPLKFFGNNFCSGISLLETIRKNKLIPVIFSSTAGVYGTGVPPYTEESPINTTSYYSMSKYFFEQALKSAAFAYGFNVTVLRYFNAAGASFDGLLGEGHHPETHLIPLVINTALGRRAQLDLFGTDYPTPDGTAVRDYIHVEDLAEAHVLAIRRLLQIRGEKGLFEIYNVGTGAGYSIREVINAVKAVSGSDFKVVEKPRREGDWDSSYANCSKIKKVLGWQTKHGLKEIVESAYRWHQSHPEGYGK